MKILHCLAASAAGILVAGAVNAAPTVIAIKDIDTSANYSDSNTGQTFTGTGFIGLYGNTPTNGQIAHLFGLEGGYSYTVAQIDLSSFLGQTITSASLDYSLLSNHSGSGTATITGYAGNGLLGYTTGASGTIFGTATGTNNTTNTVNLTSIVQAAAANGTQWLNLYFSDSTGGNWTYTGNTSPSNDAAQVRLTINASAVPEPASWAMMMIGFGLVGTALRSKRAKTSVTFG